jgi:peptide/nickel transport system substrate-binding protein
VLAAEIPSRTNGGLAADGKSVIWKLRRGVVWSDGTPFTADDVVFNHEYASDKAAGAFTSGIFLDMRFEKLDSHTVRVVFDKPSPFWAGAYSSTQIVPRHVFQPYMGARARENPANLRPVGTGPYTLVDFKPGDSLRATINQRFRLPRQPFFDTVDLKGGGDAVSAARAVLQTGDFDVAWSLQVEDEILKGIEAAGKGRVEFAWGGTIEHIQLMLADPWTETEGERGHPKSRHPILSDLRVRQALLYLTDRQNIRDAIYGRSGRVTPNYLNSPARFRSTNLGSEYSVEKANAALDAAGWQRGPDGVRVKDGRKLRLVFTSSQNSGRQKVQSAFKAVCARAGIEVELKAVVAGVFFGTDVGNPDTYGKSWADLQLYAWSQGVPDPVRIMQGFLSWEASSKANGWTGNNRGRYFSEEYDRLYRASEGEMDPLKRAALFIRMNDVACSDVAVIPVVERSLTTGLNRKLVAPLSAWSLNTQQIAYWWRQT